MKCLLNYTEESNLLSPTNMETFCEPVVTCWTQMCYYGAEKAERVNMISSFVAQYIFCVAETKQADLLAIQSAGLTAGMAAGCLAALLLSWTLTIMIAVLSTHGGSLGQSAAARLHCVWCNALMSTSVVAALLLVGAVAVIRAEFSTQP